MDMQTSGVLLWTSLKAVGIWVVSVLLAVPEAVFSEVARIGSLDNSSFTACIPYPQTDELHPKIHSVLIFLVYFLIPLVIISIYYYHIAKTLIKSAHNLPGEYNEHTKKQIVHPMKYKDRPGHSFALAERILREFLTCACIT
uniref:Neuromedin B receptor n=1 Tax=Mus musculus TaxID=10090 RepID=A0A087WRS7_MOUSE